MNCVRREGSSSRGASCKKTSRDKRDVWGLSKLDKVPGSPRYQPTPTRTSPTAITSTADGAALRGRQLSLAHSLVQNFCSVQFWACKWWNKSVFTLLLLKRREVVLKKKCFRLDETFGYSYPSPACQPHHLHCRLMTKTHRAEGGYRSGFPVLWRSNSDPKSAWSFFFCMKPHCLPQTKT